jgi:hypothetical protein
VTPDRRSVVIPFDWWTLTRTLMIEKSWTREQIGSMTMNDLRLLACADPPPEPGDTGPRKAKSHGDYLAALERTEKEANQWLS